MRPWPAVLAQRGLSVRGCGLGHFHHMTYVPGLEVQLFVCVSHCVSLCMCVSLGVYFPVSPVCVCVCVCLVSLSHPLVLHPEVDPQAPHQGPG